VVEENIAELEGEQAELAEKKGKLEGEIAALEGELEELKGKAPTPQANPRTGEDETTGRRDSDEKQSFSGT